MLMTELTPFMEPTRSDWRTCKLLESELVKKYAEDMHSIYIYCFDKEESDEMSEWTLAGQKIMTKKTTCQDHWTNHPFPHFPPEQMEDYVMWYLLHLLWIRYGRYYMGQMD